MKPRLSFNALAVAGLLVAAMGCGNGRWPPPPTEPTSIPSPTKLLLNLSDSYTGTIKGDEFLPGGDGLFGGRCDKTPCKVFTFVNFVGSQAVEARLRWTNPQHRLALYKYEGDPDSFLGRSDRYCCSADTEVVAILQVSGYFDSIAVAFEEAAPGPLLETATEPFVLTIQPPR